ncbi:MAG: hypothetical protein OEV14_09745 [Gammaproteobacteria bacterium]|nr:hypothetical protein [Gammaproteobacteria bacterium]
MKHRASARFWRLYTQLPAEIRQQADKTFQLLLANRRHPSLHLKRVGNIWSARVTDQYRVLGTGIPGGIVWVWIGQHEDYDRLIRTQLREPETPTYA